MGSAAGQDDGTPAERYDAVPALWRLRAPLLMLGLDPAWGLHRTAVEEAFRVLLLAPDAEGHAPAPAPLLAALPEEEPDGVVAEFQLEVLAELGAWGPPGEPDAEGAERVVRLARELSRSLDRRVEDCLWDHPAAHARARYLAGAPGGAGGYHEARNLAVETACRELLAPLPPGTALSGEALALCEEFSAELVATLAWLENLGR